MGVSAEFSATQPGKNSGRFREAFSAVPVRREGESEGELLGGLGGGLFG
jgi:hypothetical protein